MSERRLASRAAFLAGVVCIGLVVYYALLIGRQGGEIGSRSWFVAGWMLVAAVSLLAGSFIRTPTRRALLAGVGACMLLPLAVAAMFSIGLLLLVLAAVGGGAASVAAYQGGVGTWQRVGATLLLVAASTGLLLLGFSLTT